MDIDRTTAQQETDGDEADDLIDEVSEAPFAGDAPPEATPWLTMPFTARAAILAYAAPRRLYRWSPTPGSQAAFVHDIGSGATVVVMINSHDLAEELAGIRVIARQNSLGLANEILDEALAAR